MAATCWTLERGILSRIDRLSLTAMDGVRAGLALARMTGGALTGLGDNGSPAGQAMARAVESGVLQGGGSAWEFGRCFESQFGYCLSRSGADYGVFAGVSGELRLYARGGLPLSEAETAQFLSLLGQEGRPVFSGDWGMPFPMGNLRALYPVELIKAAGTTLSGMRLALKCANPAIYRCMEETAANLGCRIQEHGLTLQISADGRDVAVYESVQDYIHTERVLCLVCQDLFRRGQDAAVPASAPRVLDEVAACYGRQVFRYEDGLPSATDRKARSLGIRQPFLRDGLMLGLRFLSILRRSGGSLLELERQFPDYAVVSHAVPIQKPLPGGLVLAFPAGELRIRPFRDRMAVLLTAESQDMEAAAELCRMGEEKIARGSFPGSP